ncbi:hypothetical protein AURDEDRAFT_130911 [Auricularia subglabra TFB-10046 SS5]|uniref:Uncharacterized protein n=1 Tax=Auricularia subglabra (strain TFB-10046 / SS5) TaxID=717982 RepID=J0WS85_AURST|nr:hypothetical protein AURDEDRAFT_130911 [Auricularia subglabra TFB-10046 SS5]
MARQRKITLNTDVLALVFEKLLACNTSPDSCRSLAAARLVCASWNDVILSHPALWRYIVVRDNGQLPRGALATLRGVLEQSGDCSLCVTLDFSGSQPISLASALVYSQLFTAISHHMQRIESLSVIFEHAEQARFLQHFDRPAPRLRALALKCPYSPHSLAQVQFTQLHSLELAFIGLSSILQAELASLSSLRTLVLVDTDFIWSELEEVFDRCPNLGELSIVGFNFLPGGVPIPAGELAKPLRRLCLDLSFMAYLDVGAFLGAFARLPLRYTAEVEIGRVFPVWHDEVFLAILETLFEHLPALDTLSVTLDDDAFQLDGSSLAVPGAVDRVPSRIRRTIKLPEGLPKTALRPTQSLIRATLATALFLPKPAFERLSLLRLPLSVWRDLPERIDGLLPSVVELNVIWDLRSFDKDVPPLPRLAALSTVRLLKPRTRQRMILTTDKVTRLLRQYRMAYKPVLALRGVEIIMLEHDLDRFVARIVIEQVF